MSRPAAGVRRGGRLMPVAWVALAVGAAAVASLLVGASGSAVAALVGTAVSRSVLDVAAVACVGLALAVALLPEPAPGSVGRELARTVATADRAIVVLAAGWLVAVPVGLLVRAADAFGRPVSQVGVGEMVRYGTQLAAGRGMLLAAGCAAVVLGCAVARLREPGRVPVRILLIAALLGALTPSVTGHAGSAPNHQLAVTATALHAGAAALWIGGLGALLVLVARHRVLLDVALPRFSRLATACLVAVALTGLLGASVRLESPAALFATGYGLLVVTKTGALVLLAVLGGVTRRRLAAGRSPVLRWAGCEVALMAVTIGIAAALTQTAP